MEIKIELRMEKVIYLHTGVSFDDWKFIKTVVDRLLELNPDEEKPREEPKKKPSPAEPKKPGRKKLGAPKKYTEEHIDWLRDNYANISAKKLWPRFNKVFGFDIKFPTFKALLKDNDITKQNSKKPESGLEVDEAFEGEETLGSNPADEKFLA